MSTHTVSTWSQVADSGNTTSRSVSNPSGLTAGDLMVLHIGGGQFSANFTIPSGWTTLFHQTQTGGSSPRGNAMAYKVATASDVSAGSVTVASDSTTLVLGLFRITGDYVIGNASALRDSTTQTSVGMSHPSGLNEGDILLLITSGAENGNVSNVPTGWTQAYRVAGSGSAPRSRMAAYKTATATDVSNGSTTITSDSGVYERGMFVISRVVNATADISHLNITPTIEDIEGSNSTSATIDHLAITPTIESVTGKSTTDRTQWTSPNKGTTNWTNKTI